MFMSVIYAWKYIVIIVSVSLTSPVARSFLARFPCVSHMSHTYHMYLIMHMSIKEDR